MPGAKEIIRDIKKSRGNWFKYTGHRPPRWCGNIEEEVVNNLPNSHFWISTIRKESTDYLGHYVAVIGTRGRAGILVQFSGANPSDNDIVLGYVTDIHDKAEVAQVLEEKTGRKGWSQKY